MIAQTFCGLKEITALTTATELLGERQLNVKLQNALIEQSPSNKDKCTTYCSELYLHI